LWRTKGMRTFIITQFLIHCPSSLKFSTHLFLSLSIRLQTLSVLQVSIPRSTTVHDALWPLLAKFASEKRARSAHKQESMEQTEVAYTCWGESIRCFASDRGHMDRRTISNAYQWNQDIKEGTPVPLFYLSSWSK
jgi:hypothetical protein